MNDIIQKCIDSIWTEYDADNSGYLDREEAKLFVMNSVNNKEPEEAKSLSDPKRKVSILEKQK